MIEREEPGSAGAAASASAPIVYVCPQCGEEVLLEIQQAFSLADEP
jgi:predicted RNA-binding Zn-ribbon protein involved in translation (DUF1610 family)